MALRWTSQTLDKGSTISGNWRSAQVPKIIFFRFTYSDASHNAKISRILTMLKITKKKNKERSTVYMSDF